VFSSTAAVYGAPATIPIRETEPKAPINPYGRSKLAVEWMLEDAARIGMLDYVALRYFNVAGADAALRSGEWRARASHLVNVACEVALGLRDAFTIHGTGYPTADGTCVRDFIHVSDLAAAHLAALDHLRGGGTSMAINCGDGRGASVREVLETVRAVSGADIAVAEGPPRDGDPPALVADPSLAREALGWRARLGMEDMIGSALRWERKRRGLADAPAGA
jgi:UDP-glucose 4-epimerase